MDNHLHYLSANRIKLITGYYLIANLIGVALPGLVLISQNNPGFDLFYRSNTTTALILGIVGTSLMGTSIYYLNKIYKSSVFKGGKSPEKSTQHVGVRGALFYYL